MTVDSYRQPAEREVVKEPMKWAKICFFAAIAMTLTFAGWVGFRIHKDSRFDDRVMLHIYEARSASSAHEASEELSKAIEYNQTHDLDKGWTTVWPFSHDRNDNCERWNQRLIEFKGRLDSLEETDSDWKSSLEPVAVRALQENTVSSVQNNIPNSDAAPSGISIHGLNTLSFYWAVMSLILGAALWIAYGVLKPDCKWW